MLFSERYGYKEVRKILQIDSIDEQLRNSLWSLLKLFVWNYIKESTGLYGGYYLNDSYNSEIKSLFDRLWFSYFKKPIDLIPNEWNDAYNIIRDYFFSCNWFEVYDFIEFVADNYKRYNFKESFIDACNNTLKRESSGYRFIDSKICKITDKEEIEEIEKTLKDATAPEKTHISRSLELLSDRENPDYRNSIKESISAVESLAKIITNNKKGTLGQLITKLDEKVYLHPALKSAFSNLYGYTSDENGIRHALMDAETLTFDDAKFFLVICCAFTNYVRAKIDN